MKPPAWCVTTCERATLSPPWVISTSPLRITPMPRSACPVRATGLARGIGADFAEAADAVDLVGGQCREHLLAARVEHGRRGGLRGQDVHRACAPRDRHNLGSRACRAFCRPRGLLFCAALCDDANQIRAPARFPRGRRTRTSGSCRRAANRPAAVHGAVNTAGIAVGHLVVQCAGASHRQALGRLACRLTGTGTPASLLDG